LLEVHVCTSEEQFEVLHTRYCGEPAPLTDRPELQPESVPTMGRMSEAVSVLTATLGASVKSNVVGAASQAPPLVQAQVVPLQNSTQEDPPFQRSAPATVPSQLVVEVPKTIAPPPAPS
jgi:hypothetical protein